jgi:hypothetical protein
MITTSTPLPIMPAYCNRCGKKFQDSARVLNHMNQPYSSCRTYYEEVLQIAETLRTEAPHDPPNPTFNLANDPGANYEVFDSSSESIAFPELGSLPEPASMDTDELMDAPDPNDNPFFTEFYPGASSAYGIGPTFMDIFDKAEHSEERKQFLYYPFASKDEWELASFLLRSGLSMSAIDKFFKLKLVSYFSCYEWPTTLFSYL